MKKNALSSSQDNLSKVLKDETDVVQNEKLKTLGIMSAELAHEIINPLSFVNIGVDLLKNKGRGMTSQDFERTISDISDGLLRITNIVHDIKMYSRRANISYEQSETFLVGDILASCLRITANTTKNISITTTLDAPYRVVGSESSISQILVNLIINASDSIKEKWGNDGGTIDIYGRILNDRYVIEVVDNGLGIHKEDAEKVFTPFYTTKSVGTGTGLGLTISRFIVEQHGGKMTLESETDWTSISFDLTHVFDEQS